jgi:hypothetical protein
VPRLFSKLGGKGLSRSGGGEEERAAPPSPPPSPSPSPREHVARLYREVHPAVRDLLTPAPARGSVAPTVWKYALAGVLLTIIRQFLALKLLAVLVGLLSREYLGSRSPLTTAAAAAASAAAAEMCPADAGAYAVSEAAAAGMSAARLFGGARGVPALAALWLLAAGGAPLLGRAGQEAISARCMEEQLQHWRGDVEAKFDFQDEASQRLTLARALLGGVLLLGAAGAAAALLPSPASALAALLAASQLLAVVFMSPSEGGGGGVDGGDGAAAVARNLRCVCSKFYLF